MKVKSLLVSFAMLFVVGTASANDFIDQDVLGLIQVEQYGSDEINMGDLQYEDMQARWGGRRRDAYEGMYCYTDRDCFRGANGLVCHRGQCTHRSRFRYCRRDADCYRGLNGHRCFDNICRPMRGY